MLMKQKMLVGLTVIGLCAAPLANAFQLVLVNNTKVDSTSFINPNLPPKTPFCSSDIPVYGTTHPGQKNTLTEWEINLFCKKGNTNCQADVYMTSKCDNGGKAHAIAKVILNTANYSINLTSLDESEYKISFTGGNTITVDPVLHA